MILGLLRMWKSVTRSFLHEISSDNYPYITLHYNYNYRCKYNCNYNNYNYTILHYATLGYTSLYHCTIHNTTVHYITLITHCNCNCHCTTLITLHYNYDSTTLYFNYNYKCITPHYIQQLWWGDPCNHCSHSKKHNSNHLSVHQWIRSALRDSQQPLVQVSYFWIFRHRVVRYYWYGTGGCEQNRQRQWTKIHPFKMFQGTAAAIFSL